MVAATTVRAAGEQPRSCRTRWPAARMALPGRRGPRAGLRTREPGHLPALERVAQRNRVRHLKA
jgi:hypothetical protein